MFPVLFFLISLTGLIIATYTDLKERIISNKLTYTLIVAGIVLQLAYAIAAGDLWIFGTAIGVMAAGFIWAYVLWRLGAWAGGDVKLFTALCALNPVNYVIIGNFAGIGTGIFSAYSHSLPLFPLSFFLFSIFSMLPYGAMLSIKGILENRSIRKELVGELKRRSVQLTELSIGVVGIGAALTALGLTTLLVLPALIVLAFLNFWMRIAIITILFAFALLQNPFDAIYTTVLFFLPLLFIYLLLKLYFVSKDKILKKEIAISEMEEGMISGETIVLKDGQVERLKGIKTGNIINYLRNNNVERLLGELNPKGMVLASSRSAAGITAEQLEELKLAVKENKIDDRIKIKLSAPFVPAMLIAYLILQLVGDVLWNVLFP